MAEETFYPDVPLFNILIDQFGITPSIVVVNQAELADFFQDVPEVSLEEAGTALQTRMQDQLFGGDENAGLDLKPFHDYVLGQLPSGMRTLNVVQNIDLRPFVKSYTQLLASLTDDQLDAIISEYKLESERQFVSGPMGMGVWEIKESTPQTWRASLTDLASAMDAHEQDLQGVVDETTTQGAELPESADAGISSQTRVSTYQASGDEDALTAIMNALGSPTGAGFISEDQLYSAFVNSRQDDFLQLGVALAEYENQNMQVDAPTFMLEQYASPSSGGGGTRAGAGLSYEQAINYLRSNKLNEALVRNMQDKLIAAGYADVDYDGVTDNIIPGDAWDPLTDKMYLTALKDLYVETRGEEPLNVFLARKAEERRQRLPVLDNPMNNLLIDSVAQQMIGRYLSADEKTKLWSQIQTSWDTGGLAADGQDPSMGFNEQDIQGFVAEELPMDVQQRGAGGRLQDAIAILNGSL